MEGGKKNTILPMMDIPKEDIQLHINIKYLGGVVGVSVKCADTSGNY